MLEYHGWVTLRGNHESSDEIQNELVYSQMVALVTDRMRQIKASNRHIEVPGQNGNPFLSPCVPEIEAPFVFE